jgi:hypothetical protein
LVEFKNELKNESPLRLLWTFFFIENLNVVFANFVEWKLMLDFF